MKKLITFLTCAILLLVSSPSSAVDAVTKISGTNILTGPIVTGAQTITVSANGTLVFTSGFTLTGGAYLKTALSLNAVENTALSTWAGSSNLTTAGTLTTAVWNASVIAPAYLGTGSSIATKFLRGDGTWQTVSGSGGGGTWGTITGTLSDQSDLQTALNAKLATSVAFTTYSPIAGSTAITTLGTVTTGTFGGTLAAISGAALTSLNASNIASGILAAAHLPGTAALTTSTLAQFATTTSAQLLGVISDASGTGVLLTANGSAAALTSFPTFNQNTTGLAGTATALATPRTINAVGFDGTANIIVTAAAGTLTGTTLNSTVVSSSLTGVGVLASGSYQATPVADAYISSASAWNAKEHVLTFSGGVTRTSNNVAVDAALSVTNLSNLTSNGFVKTSSSTGALSVDTTAYTPTSVTINGHALTGNVSVTGGDVGLGSVTNDVQTKASVVPNTAPASGQVLTGNAGGTAYAPVSVSGDIALTYAGLTTLATVNSNTGTFGSATQSLTATFDAKGRVTAVTAQTVTPAESSITFTDITTGNASSSKHGLTPKLPNDATVYLNGVGGFSSPPSGVAIGTTVVTSGTDGNLLTVASGKVGQLSPSGLNAGTATALATAREINGLHFDGTADVSDYAADTGATNAYVTTPSPAPSAYVTGAQYRFKAASANTGACTINISGLGAKSIVKAAGGITTALVANDILSGQMCILIYDGTNMQIVSTLGNAAGGGGSAGWLVKTSNYTGVAGDKILADVTSGAFTITLPASPSDGDSISVQAERGTFASHNLTIGRNGETINGASANLVLDGNSGVDLIYSVSYGWQSAFPLVQPGSPTVSSLRPAGYYGHIYFPSTTTEVAFGRYDQGATYMRVAQGSVAFNATVSLLGWSSGDPMAQGLDTGMSRIGAGTVGFVGDSVTGGAVEMLKRSAYTPSANSAGLYAKVVSGATQLVAVSSSGETQLTGIRFPAIATLNFPSTAAGAVSDLTISVTGAAVGDVVSIGIDAASVPAGGSFSAWVSATDTVTVRYSNNSLVTAYDPASGSFKVIVFKQ
jgi:hypothetical protein